MKMKEKEKGKEKGKKDVEEDLLNIQVEQVLNEIIQQYL